MPRAQVHREGLQLALQLEPPGPHRAAKRARRQEEGDGDGGGAAGVQTAAEGGEAAAEGQGEAAAAESPAGAAFGEAVQRATPVPVLPVVSCRPGLEARGHTGYLTFARKFV